MKKNGLFLQDIRILPLLIVLFCFYGASNIMAQQSRYGIFPFEESFLGSTTAPAGVEKAAIASGVVGMENSANFTLEGVQLTPNASKKFGAIFLKDQHFTSELGIFIEFEYMVYGGTGGDGLCMFLFDAEIENPTIGANGAGIGYAYNRAYNGIPQRNFRMPGLSGAYLGVALDAFGNFKGLRYQGESRVSGIPFSISVSGSLRAEDNKQNQVSLRGARGPAMGIVGMEVGYTGYPLLKTQGTYDEVITNPITTITMDEADLSKYKITQEYKGNRFKINGDGKFSGPGDAAYRKAMIELFPAGANPGGGFYVTVKIQHGAVVDTLIYDYQYKTTTRYQENATTATGGDSNSATDLPLQDPTVNRIVNLNTSVPDSLRIGFAASTGEKYNFHVIKNVKITLPRAAEANDDSAKVNQNFSSATIYPLVNDYGYEGPISRGQVKSPEHINPATFRFIDENGDPLTNPYTNNDGTWTYNETTEEVTFRRGAGFSDKAEIRYDVYGNKTTANPYSDPAYRSPHATIGVYVDPDAPVITRNTIINKMITTKLNN